MNQNRVLEFGKFARAGQFLGGAVILASCPLLASCAVFSPLAVESTGGDVGSQSNQIAISLPEGGTQPLKARFGDALIDALTDGASGNRVEISENGRLIADYSVSTGSAEVGVLASNAGQDAAVWIAPPRPPKRFDECEAMLLRGTLLLLDRDTGAVVYRGTGAMTDCEFGDADLRAMADGLVADYLGR